MTTRLQYDHYAKKYIEKMSYISIIDAEDNLLISKFDFDIGGSANKIKIQGHNSFTLTSTEFPDTSANLMINIDYK